MSPLDVTRSMVDGLGAEGDVCMKCGSRSLGLCAPLDAATLGDMAADSERVMLEPRAPTFHHGDHVRYVYTLTDGTARLMRVLPEGRQAAIGFRFAGGILGFTPGEEHAFGVEMLIGGRVCRMERCRPEQLFRRQPLLERRFLDLHARDLA
ncbi:MAG: Crp/Fnr family transcriptional regulator [Alphaproteobacteria bacterium]|nr:Crp/Fnr family transcriptional regulator [Alphaproteobacteria bacterium]